MLKNIHKTDHALYWMKKIAFPEEFQKLVGNINKNASATNSCTLCYI